jgi:DNA repair exonuclease SbcCD ATPase subunit
MGLGITTGFFSLIKQFNHNLTSDIFVIILIAIFVWGYRDKRIRETTPTILTMIGILGTFLGIIIGLSQFDVRAIDASIPHLLDGLKVAFIVSATGVFLAILFKKIDEFQSKFKGTETQTVIESEVTPKMIYDVIAEGNKQQKQLFNELKRSITGEDDSSLVNQLIRLRSDVTDSAKNSQEITRRGFEAIQETFREFADKVVETGSKSLVEALESTIKDFNMKLSEQFGENFKQLNEAVKELVTWQENYRVQMEDMRNDLQKTQSSFEFALQGIKKSEISLKEIAESTSFIAKQTEAIPQTMNSLSQLMQGLDTQSQTLATHLNSFKELGEKATSALPKIKQIMDDLMKEAKDAQMMIVGQLSALKLGFDSLKSAADTVARETVASLQQLQQMIQQGGRITAAMGEAEQSFAKFKGVLESQNKIADALSGYFNQFTEVTKEFDGTLKSQKSTFAELKRGFDELKGQLDERVSKLRTEFDHANKNLQQVIDNQFKSFDEQMTKDVQRTVDQFGTHLLSLSTGFVDNYEKLTRQLSKTVEDLRKEIHNNESRK